MGRILVSFCMFFMSYLHDFVNAKPMSKPVRSRCQEEKEADVKMLRRRCQYECEADVKIMRSRCQPGFGSVVGPKSEPFWNDL